jgi:acyl phosphate:glycerol-3-phosphate acyltransferase
MLNTKVKMLSAFDQSVRKHKPWAGLTILFPSIRPASKKDMQILRKIWHVCAIGSIGLIYAKLVSSQKEAILLVAAIGGPFLLLDFLRLKWRRLNRIATFAFGPLMRKKEFLSLSGLSYFVIGLFAVVIIFPKPIAILSILCLAVGDPIASIVGIAFGKHTLVKGKSVQGTLACFGVCTVLTMGVLGFYGIPADYLFLCGILGGMIVAAAEALSSRLLDDNLVIPIATASFMYPIVALITSL